ncbi:hypothetical protein FNV43_RR27076 [Rhamnella rubrinervis]|uniref:BAR domain-containing protein n=1 Tax=Rhamnella rubrinervis TaxID=2594499 RepID=A0A8K0DKZ5_9ROSA|nr:hypothetical protein FNV43_RR27076 [Rhamnella rubrinervis]
MKTSLRKLRGLALHKHEAKDRRDLRPFAQLDELAQASQDMHDMRDCYDSLLSAAAATANSAYEFSESLREMGACLLEKTALNDDEESGKVLLKLGKVQYELQKLIDNYRSHIFQTITVPSESLLNELRTVEEMKRQCDEKRDVYEYMKTRQREKVRSRIGKGESFSMQQLQMARDEYNEEATLFIFRLKSLKQGQSRSLLTQAARHHAAQLCFFRKSHKSLEALEPHVKMVTEQQHIDYHFGGLEDDDRDDEDDNSDDDEDDSYDVNDDGELSFDYGQNDQERDISVSTSRNSMELDQVDLTFPKVTKVESVKENLDRLRRYSSSFRSRMVSQSAPLFAENKVDPAEKLRQMRPSFSRKFHSYVLPTPIDTKGSVSTGSVKPVTQTAQTKLSERTQNLWHSSPLDLKKYETIMTDQKVSGPAAAKVQSVLKESNNIASTQLPPPLLDGLIFPRHDIASDSKKIKRHAFSGPLASKAWPTKPVTVKHPQLFSGPLLRSPIPQPPSSSPKVSPNASPTFMSSPKISELHELPRPPSSSTYKSSRPPGVIGHSAPLVPRVQAQSNTKVGSNAASPLPKPPPLGISRSFSVPSSDPRVVIHASKPMEAFHCSQIAEEVASPPLTPIALSNN